MDPPEEITTPNITALTPGCLDVEGSGLEKEAPHLVQLVWNELDWNLSSMIHFQLMGQTHIPAL